MQKKNAILIKPTNSKFSNSHNNGIFIKTDKLALMLEEIATAVEAKS